MPGRFKSYYTQDTRLWQEGKSARVSGTEKARMGKPRLLFEDHDDVTVVIIEDDSILEMAVIDRLGKELFDLTDKHKKQKLVLDFSNVQFLASRTLGILLSLHKKSRAIQGQTVLCGVGPVLKKVFTVTSLDAIFQFFPDQTTALAHFNVSQA